MAILDAQRLSAVLTALAGVVRAAPRSKLPDGLRTDLIMLLEEALLGPAGHDEYLQGLAALQPPLSLTAAVPVPVEMVVSNGLSGVSDEQLIGLASNPTAFRSLGQRVCGALCNGRSGDCWTDVVSRAAERLEPDPALAGVAQRTFDEFEEIRRQVRKRKQKK
jgi:hypothetical protein